MEPPVGTGSASLLIFVTVMLLPATPLHDTVSLNGPTNMHRVLTAVLAALLTLLTLFPSWV